MRGYRLRATRCLQRESHRSVEVVARTRRLIVGRRLLLVVPTASPNHSPNRRLRQTQALRELRARLTRSVPREDLSDVTVGHLSRTTNHAVRRTAIRDCSDLLGRHGALRHVTQATCLRDASGTPQRSGPGSRRSAATTRGSAAGADGLDGENGVADWARQAGRPSFQYRYRSANGVDSGSSNPISSPKRSSTNEISSRSSAW